MKKQAIFGIVVFLLIVGLVFAASLSKEQKNQINNCKLDCGAQKKADQKSCQEEGNSCVESCKEEYAECLNTSKTGLDSCNVQCEQTFPFNDSMSLSQKRKLQKNQYLCKKECQRNFTIAKRNECDVGACKRECAQERSECIGKANEDHRFCSQSCQYMFLNSSITCEDGRYQAGQTIWRECDTCRCGYDGKLKCTQHASCNFNGLNETSQEECESAGGFYQELCQGNIYAMRCTEEFYCQCDGFNEYTCPQNQICLKDFKTQGILSGNLKTWSERRGLPLGDIGICTPLPEIESCGNGICEDVVVNGVAETKLNCAADCDPDSSVNEQAQNIQDPLIPFWELRFGQCQKVQLDSEIYSGFIINNVTTFINQEQCDTTNVQSSNDLCAYYYNDCENEWHCTNNGMHPVSICPVENPNKYLKALPDCEYSDGICHDVT